MAVGKEETVLIVPLVDSVRCDVHALASRNSVDQQPRVHTRIWKPISAICSGLRINGRHTFKFAPVIYSQHNTNCQ